MSPRVILLSSQGSVAERSKALDLGSSLSGGVGSNPTTAKTFLSQSKVHLMLLSVPNAVLATNFTIIIPLSKCHFKLHIWSLRHTMSVGRRPNTFTWYYSYATSQCECRSVELLA